MNSFNGIVFCAFIHAKKKMEDDHRMLNFYCNIFLCLLDHCHLMDIVKLRVCRISNPHSKSHVTFLITDEIS